MSAIVLRRGETEFDHVVLGTFDTRAGADWLSDQTGAKVTVTEPEPGQWYHSAVLPLKQGSFVEVLGPNPAHKGFHPIKQLLSGYDTPRPLFWHLATDDFDGFCARLDAAGAQADRIEELDSEGASGRRAYKRAIVGPGFRTVRPCFIQWIARPDRTGVEAPVCSAVAFSVRDREPEKLNRIFEALGLALRATQGPQTLSVDLDTPKGKVVLSGDGQSFEGAGAMLLMGKLYLRYLVGGARR